MKIKDILLIVGSLLLWAVIIWGMVRLLKYTDLREKLYDNMQHQQTVEENEEEESEEKQQVDFGTEWITEATETLETEKFIMESSAEKEETEAETETESEAEEYVLPDSDSRYLTLDDLEGLSAEECRIARNEIYARHGRRFKDEELQAYFDSCSWYQGTVEPKDFQEESLNDYEFANRDLIVLYEKEQGYR